jgi:hypothetical protein
MNYNKIKEKPMTHAYNPSNSGGRDQEDHCLKPAWTNSLRDLLLKILNNNKKRADGVAQGIGPEFKPQHQTQIHKAL